jgi:hypothetical protein
MVEPPHQLAGMPGRNTSCSCVSPRRCSGWRRPYLSALQRSRRHRPFRPGRYALRNRHEHRPRQGTAISPGPVYRSRPEGHRHHRRNPQRVQDSRTGRHQTLTYAPGPKRTACRSKTAAGPRPTSSPSTRRQQARKAELRKGSGHPQHQQDRASPHSTRARGWVRPGSQKGFQNWGRIADRFRPLDTDTERTGGTQLCDL